MAYVGPEWWHHHGMKMKLEVTDRTAGLKISNNAAHLVLVLHHYGNFRCLYKVRHSREEYAEGIVILTRQHVRDAFGLDFPTSVAEAQGKFFRYGDYLNIPNKGTGHDGDPNISIELDDKIRGAVEDLLRRTK